MKWFMTVPILIVGLAFCQQVTPGSERHIVLPNPALLRCSSSSCSQLWPDGADANGIYPVQVVIDSPFSNSKCHGMKVRYGKSVSLDDVKAALDERYGKWALQPGLWRVESERFVIQLSKTSVKTTFTMGGEAMGTTQVIYLPSIGHKDCH